MDDKTRDFKAQGSSTRFWDRRRTRMASATGSLLLAVAATIFMLHGGPSSVTWLNGSHPSWLPFGGSVSWLPFGHASAATPTPHPSPTPTPVPVVVAHTPAPAPVVVHTPVPTARPTAAPVTEPTAKPTAKPTPTPTPTPTATPTPAGPAPGTVLFYDTFENDPLGPAVANWSVSPATGVWSIALDGTNVLANADTGASFPTAFAGSPEWTNYRVSADVKVNPTNGHARLIARHYGDGYFYACGLDHSGTLFLGKEYGGVWYEFKSTPYSYVATAWYHIDFSVVGNNLTCTVTDPVSKATATLTDTESYFPRGGVGATGENGAEFDNFVVTAL